MDRHRILSLIFGVLLVLSVVASYFFSFQLAEDYFLKTAFKNNVSCLKVSLQTASKTSSVEDVKEAISNLPYVKKVELKSSPSSEFVVSERFNWKGKEIPITIYLDEELIEKKAKEVAQKVTVVVSLVFSLIFLIYYLLVRFMYVNPMKKIRRDIERISNGILERVPESGPDSFKKIRRSINGMIDKIREKEAHSGVISRFIQLLALGKGFSSEFINLMRRVLYITGADAVVVAVKPPFSKNLVSVRLITKDKVENYSIKLEKFRGVARTLLREGREVEFRDGSIEISDSLKLGYSYAFGEPLEVLSQVLGFVLFLKGGEPEFSDESKRFIRNLAKVLAVGVEIRYLIVNLEKKVKREKELFNKVLKSLVRGIEVRDTYTRGHSERVAFYSKRIAQEMGLSKEEVKSIYIAALLHDIGKIGIPDSILLKPGKLSDKEYEIIKYHPILSFELLKNLDFLEEALDGIKYHHERWNGAGYPEGLKGGEIPLSARIIAVADSFDAMTSDRIYRKARSKEEALEELERLSGIAFDPKVVEVALKVLSTETPCEAQDDYLDNPIIKEIEERRLDYFLRDPLTGVFNRGALELAYLTAKELFGELSALVVDVVRLREINIREGWKRGDEVLRSVVDGILSRVPESVVVRYSGDNFVVFLPRYELYSAEEKVKALSEELGVRLRVLAIEDVFDVEELKKELTRLEFEA